VARPMAKRQGEVAKDCLYPLYSTKIMRCARLAVETMRQRDFFALLCAVTLAGLKSAPAQQPAMPVIAFFNANSAHTMVPYVDIFRRTLQGAGYVEGRNVAVEYRWGDGQIERFPALLSDLLKRRVDVLFVGGNNDLILSAKAATSTIPIVFTTGADPVATGLVASLNRPGGNITGSTVISYDVRAKQVDLLRKLVPTAPVFGHLVAPAATTTASAVADVAGAAQTLGWPVKVFHATSARDFDRVFAEMADQKIGALVVQDQALFNSNAQQLALLAARYRIAGLYIFRDHPDAGSLMSYGPSRPEAWRQASFYVARILKGEKPADLPVQQATRFEMVLNLKTARAIGLDIPTEILTLADEVIE
jgi:putative ABC transport system substrate-binding protein